MTNEANNDTASAGLEPGACSDGPCSEATSHLWDYLDGELSEGDCARIKAHVGECPPCEDLFKNEKKIKDAVSRACGCEHAPQDLRGRVITMIAALRLESCGGSRSEKQPEPTRATE